MSTPRPIHQPQRELRSVPDEEEPSLSCEQDSFIEHHAEEVEDEFFRRQEAGRRDSGGGSSFWRTSMEAAAAQPGSPQFSSMHMKRTEAKAVASNGPKAGNAKGGMGAALLASSSEAEKEKTKTEAADKETAETRQRKGAFSRKDSSASVSSTSSQNKKDLSRNRKEARLIKLEAATGEVDVGRIPESPDGSDEKSFPESPTPVSRGSTSGSDFSISLTYSKNGLTRMSSVGSATGSSSGVLLGKSSSLIFPTGVEANTEEAKVEVSTVKKAKINVLLDQCESVRFPFKKKLMLENLNLTSSDLPVGDLCNTSLGNNLHKLSLSGNRLSVIPDLLVCCLPVLKTLDLSQCDLHQLPEKWNLPQLKRLNLSHNRLVEFPDEVLLEGLPELQDLNMYGNKVADIVVPRNPKVLSKLETLNLGYNDLAYLPDDLDKLKALRYLKVQNNFLEKVPSRVCDMDIRSIDVSSNPVIQPPIETCERGVCSMKRYYACLRLEEQAKQKAMGEVKKKLDRQRKKEGVKLRKKRFFSAPSAIRPPLASSPETSTKAVPDIKHWMGTPTSSETRKVIAVKEPNPRIEKPGVAASARAGSSMRNLRDNPRDLEEVTDYPKAPSTVATEEDLDRGDSLGSVMSYPERAALDSAGELSTDAKAALSSMDDLKVEEKVTVNDTLKVIFVGMALAGKTSMIKRLIEGRDAVIPKRDERTVGVDIYEWDPKKDKREEIRHIDTRIDIQDNELANIAGDVNVKFSVWDFAGQHVYHATHELFFSPRALYILVWDMGATNSATQRKTSKKDDVSGAYKLSYDSSDDEEEDDFAAEEEARRADRALERDVDEKVQFWVDCIQSSAPGAAIMPVASFDDFFESGGSKEEARRRCGVMKRRLLKHEQRRVQGLKDRLKEFESENRANDEGALRLRKLLCPYVRPKLIFGNSDEDSVVRVSGTKYTGFDVLTQKIVNIAAGRDQAGWKYPIFRGHVGVRIPKMRLKVRDGVRKMRDRFKVVEWGYFLSNLSQIGNYNVEDVSDALHFLTNVGELSYFGNVFPDKEKMMHLQTRRDSNVVNPNSMPTAEELDYDSDVSYDEDHEGKGLLSIDDTSTTVQSTTGDDMSLTASTGPSVTGLSQFVFLNPRWLVAAVACILRHDLSREITETRRLLNAATGRPGLERGDSFVYDANLNCPVITASDACLLWQAKKFTKKAAERAQEYSNNMTVTPFDFLQKLLIRFGVFVPIDLSIEKAYLGGKEYTYNEGVNVGESHPPAQLQLDMSNDDAPETPNFFFLPSLLGPGEPSEAWTYKNTDSWTTTLCHSILFPDGVPPGLMERVTASVLSSIYTAATNNETSGVLVEGHLRMKEILCWRTAFFLKIGIATSDNGELKEGITEIFCHIADRDSHMCPGSDAMGVGMRRLVLSAKGQVGDNGRKIWTGGYLLVIKAVGRVMNEYGGLEYEKQGFCPECLSKKAISQASAWHWTVLRAASQNGDETLRCHHGHRVDTRLVTGPSENLQRPRLEAAAQPRFTDGEPIVPVSELLRGVVVVGLWDGKTRKIVRAGSGFIVDKKRGLIVTASHTLMNIWGDKKYPFGENYYGLRDAKVAIGVISRNKGSDPGDSTMAVFRYFAKIVAKDESIESKGECHLDACVLRITTRMENDVGGDGHDCGDQPETLLLYNPDAVKREKLHQLKVTDKCELDEQVRILGYNQGGEGLLGPGENLNRYVDFARGYVCMKFATIVDPNSPLRHRFKPHKEIVVICPTIGGHSGGPCVNQQGEVIGILSRADPAESQRCYLVPAYEWKALVKKAKNTY